MIYQNPDDYPTLYEVFENGWEGAKGGIFMGAILGGASSTVGHYQNRARRKHQGKIMLADTQDGVLEVLGNIDGDKYMAVDGDGRPREITRDMVNDFQVVPFDEFDKYCREQTDENLQKAVDSGRALAAEDTERGEKRAAKLELDKAEKMLSEEQMEELNIRPIEYLSEHEDEASVLIPYLNAKFKFDGMIAGIRDGIDEKVSASNQHIANLTHQDGNVYDVTLTADDKKHVYPISGSIVIGENGIIDRKQSDKRFITRDENGNIEMRSVEDLYKVESFENSDVMKEITAQSIREQESARHAEEIETPNEEEKVQEVESLVAEGFDDISIDDYIQSNHLSEFGKQRAYDREEESVNRAIEQARLSIAYRNGEIGAKEMLVNDVYRYMDDTSNERLREQANSLSEYWANRYPDKIKISQDEAQAAKKKNGTENTIEGEEIAGDIKNEEEKENISSEISPSENGVTSIIEQPIETSSSESGDANTLIDPVSIEQAPSTIGIPVDDKGNELYHKVPVETTLENVRSYGLDESEMDEFVAAQKAEAT